MVVNQIEMKNTALKVNTMNIKAGVMATAQGYLMIGEALNNIRNEKLWRDDFNSFADYCERALNVKQATAYRIIQTAMKFLAPERGKAPSELIFTPFHDTALAALNPVGDYETTAEFINENNITPATSVSEIRKLVKQLRQEESEEAEQGNEPETETDMEAEQSGDELSTLIQIVANAENCRDKRKRKQRAELKTALEKIAEILDL